MTINSNILRYSAAFLAAALSFGQPQADSSKAIPLSKVERKG
jgi:hypothetical protein